jgi:hypothetical protein
MTESFADYKDLATDEVELAQFLSRDEYGAPSYGSPVTYTARVVYNSRQVHDAKGNLRMSQGFVWMEYLATLTEEDQITLPDGSTPEILMVNKYIGHHSKVTFG